MFLCYFDDSGSDRHSPICVFGGVIVPGELFGTAEAITAVAADRLGLADSLQEFKAGALHSATGPFTGLDKIACRESLMLLVNILSMHSIPFIYSAVRREMLRQDTTLNRNPVELAFRMCLSQLEAWARSQGDLGDGKLTISYKNTCVVIADECDHHVRVEMLKTFRQMRRQRPLRPGEDFHNRLHHVHDSMYFGSSADSIGLQLADAAAWSMNRFLRGASLDSRVVECITSASICAKSDPLWSEHRELFIDHDDWPQEGQRGG